VKSFGAEQPTNTLFTDGEFDDFFSKYYVMSNSRTIGDGEMETDGAL
jgi:hypothetical protein